MSKVIEDILSDNFFLQGDDEDSCLKAFKNWENSLKTEEIDFSEAYILYPVSKDEREISFIILDGENELSLKDNEPAFSGEVIHLPARDLNYHQNAILATGDAFSEDFMEFMYLIGRSAYQPLCNATGSAYLPSGIARYLSIAERAVLAKDEKPLNLLYVQDGKAKKIVCARANGGFNIYSVESLLAFLRENEAKLESWTLSHATKKIIGRKQDGTSIVISCSDTGSSAARINFLDKSGRILNAKKIEAL